MDVNKGAVVGERSNTVRAVSGTDSVDGRLRSGRGVGGISTVVTSSDGHEDTSGDSVGSGGVDSSGLATSKRHGADGTVGAATGLSIVGDKVDTSNDTRVGTRTLSVEDLDSVKLSVLSDTVGLGANGTGAVSAVAVAVSVVTITSEVLEECSTALELGVGGGNTGVDDVDAGARASAGVVDVLVVAALASSVRDTRKTPGRSALRGEGLLLDGLKLTKVGSDVSILLDVLDLVKTVRTV